MLKDVFEILMNNYADASTVKKLWNNIIISYNDVGRYYHTFSHLERMYNQLLDVREDVDDWDVLVLALIYHDIVYLASKSNNEAESAAFAENQLKMTSLTEDRLKRCVLHIFATKGHTLSTDNDTNLFTDADLSILGSDSDIYHQYTKQIRKEYFSYADSVYIEGRVRTLDHFLSMDRIFKTDYFFERYENIARKNLFQERSYLSEI